MGADGLAAPGMGDVAPLSCIDLQAVQTSYDHVARERACMRRPLTRLERIAFVNLSMRAARPIGIVHTARMVQIKVLADLRDCAIQPVAAASTFLFILIAHSLKNGCDPRRIGMYRTRRQGRIARMELLVHGGHVQHRKAAIYGGFGKPLHGPGPTSSAQYAQRKPSSRIRLNQGAQLLPGLDGGISKADGWQP
jgi:hypothetical protein